MGDNFTGREHDHDVLENEEQVAAIIENLNTIATKGVSDAFSEVSSAVQALNDVNGMAEYVGTVNVSEVETIFTGESGISESVKALAEAMQASADSIKEYDESEWYEKAGSTILMSLCKVGEGLLNIVEDLGDGVMSLVGFVTNDWFGTGAMSSAIKAEWSHDVFNGYYNSDLAKKSAYTEDSTLAGGIKIASTTAGYIAIAACTAGVGSGLAGAGGAAATFASSTTIANTVIAGVAGLGSGTESGLRQDKGFYQAFFENGLPQGAAQAAVAFAAGKAGEHIAKAKAVKAAEADVASARGVADSADDAFSQAIKDRAAASTRLSKANEAFDTEFKTLADKTTALAEKNAAQIAYDKANQTWLQAGLDKSKAFDALSSAETNLAETSAAKAATFQGYSDKITQKFYEKGYKAGSNWRELGFVQGTKANASGVVGDVVSGVKTVATPVVHPIQTAKSVGSAVVNTVAHPVQTVKSIPTAIASAASSVNPVTTVASVPGLVGAAANSGGREISASLGANASTYDVKTAPQEPYTINSESDVSKRIADNFTGGTQTPSDNPTDNGNTDNGNNNNNNNNNNNSNNKPSGNNSSNNTGSNSTGSNSTGSSPSYQQTDDSSNKTDTTQLKQTDDSVKEVEKTDTQPAQEQPQQEQTPVETPAANQPQQEAPAAVYEQPQSDGGDYTTYHTGGGYSGDGYYPAETGEELADLDTTMLNPLDESLLDNTTSIDEIVKGSKYTKIPSSSKPITTTTSTGSGSSAVIPIAAGLSAAAAAGIGAKAYMDRKKNNDVDDDEDDDFETEEWSGDEEEGIKYDESSDNQYLDTDDDYSYQATESEEKYGARNSDELADLQ